MSIANIFKVSGLLLLTLLTACGGGSDEPSNLLVSTGSSTSTGGTSSTTSDDTKDITIAWGHHTMVPAGGSTEVLVITYDGAVSTTSTAAEELSKLPVLPQVTMEATVTSPATLNGSATNLSLKSDNRGQVLFTVNHPGSGTAIINIRGTGKYKGGFSSTLYFGGSVAAAVTRGPVFTKDELCSGTDQQATCGLVPANGKTSAEVTVFVRDADGVGLPNIPVELSFSPGSFAVPGQAQGVTDTQGNFRTVITNTLAQIVQVTPIAGGMVGKPVLLTFKTTEVTSPPQTLDFIVKQDNVASDGQAAAILVVVARDESGTPIRNVPINITSNSATALLSVGETKNTFFINGNTGDAGSFELRVTNTVEESVTLTASTTGSDGKKLTNEVSISFTPMEAIKGGKLQLDEPLNNSQKANGTDKITLRGWVLVDDQGQLKEGKTVRLILSGGSAKLKLVDEGKTDSSGRFFATLTDEVAEEFKVKAMIGELSSNEVLVKFIAVQPEEGKGGVVRLPQSMTLIATPAKQIVDDGSGGNKITLTAIVRDTSNTPMEGVKVTVSTSSNTAIFKEAQQTTGAGGTATFEVSNTLPGSFNITATGQLEDKDGNPVGKAVTASQTVTFYEAEAAVVTELSVAVTDDRKPASGKEEDSITVTVTAKDSQGNSMKGVLVNIQMATSSAKASPARGKTGEDGTFMTKITSTVAGEVPITIAAENSSVTESTTLTFIARPGIENPLDSVSLDFENSPQPADGESKITLIATPRDAKGIPIAGITIELKSEPVNKEAEGEVVFTKTTGTSNVQGQFRTFVTSNGAGDFYIWPTASAEGGQNQVNGPKKIVTFTPPGIKVAELVVNVVNDNQVADGTASIKLEVITRQGNGQPLSNVPVNVLVSKGARVIVSPSQGTTDVNGMLPISITSSQPGKAEITVMAGEPPTIYSREITFKASETTVVTPSRVETRIVSGPNLQPKAEEYQIVVAVVPYDENNNIISDTGVELIADSNTAKVTPLAPEWKTNSLGEARFEVTETIAHDVKITPIVGGKAWDPITLPFSGNLMTQLVVTVVNDNQLAGIPDGTKIKPIQIDAMVRSTDGQPLVGAPIVVQLPVNSKAVATPFEGLTTKDSGGLFTTTITSPVSGVVPITFLVKDSPIPSQSVTVTFVTTSPQEVILNVLNSPQPADGNSGIDLVVIPRNNGNPLPDTNVQLISDPPSLTSQEGITNVLDGTTNAVGEYRTTLKSKIPGTFKITPIVWKEGETKLTGVPVEVRFAPVGQAVADLTVTVVNNNQPATGKDEAAIKIDVVARDSGGRPLAGIPIVVQLPTGTAAVMKELTEDEKLTKANGHFSTEITSTVPGEVAVTIAVKDTTIAHPPVVINFISPPEGEGVSKIDPKTTQAELLVLNAPQPVGSPITLLVKVRDEIKGNLENKGVSEVKVRLIHDSLNAKFGEGGSAAGGTDWTTDSLGEFRTTLTNTVAETVNVTLVLDGIIFNQEVPVIFTPRPVRIPASLTLAVELEKDKTTLTVFAYDENHVPFNGVPVTFYTLPGEQPPDVSNTAKFESAASGYTGGVNPATIDPKTTTPEQLEEKLKEGNGTFSTSISNSVPGTFKVVAKVTGTSLSSNVVEVTFSAETKGGVPEVNSIELLTNNAQLGSEGASEGVLITAILKDKDNKLVEGAAVNFKADSGEIVPIQIENSEQKTPGMTDASGRAQARLTTQGNPNNRTITVTASVATATGEVKEDSITIEVIGTKLTVAGPTSVIINTEIPVTLWLKNSADKGIAGQTLTVNSELGNTFSNPAPVTNALGQAEVMFTPSRGGEDTITVTREGAESGKLKVTISDDNFTITPSSSVHGLCSSLANNEDLNNNRILDEGEDLNKDGKLNLGCQVPLRDPQSFQVHWDKGGAPQVFAEVVLSTTRGSLSKDSVTTDLNGNATFTVTSGSDTGTATIIVRTKEPTGPSRTINLKFVATEVGSVTVQASPSAIGVNTAGKDDQRSQILVVVRDPNNNLVFGQVVTFMLTDISGGRLTQGSAITDEFGRASTTYIAGNSSSAANGVEVKASVGDKSDLVKLSVARKGVFVKLGSGNAIISDRILYQVPYTVLVTDATGVPVGDANVILSIYPSKYIKGGIEVGEKGLTINKLSPYCENEDFNRNGLLDLGEDFNQDGKLDPGNVITVDKSVLKTDNNGYASFKVVYAVQYAEWVEAEITARTETEGSEDSDTLTFETVCPQNEVTDKTCPTQNPFGSNPCDKKD